MIRPITKLWQKLRKFSSGYYEFSDILWNVIILLKMYYINVDSKTKKRLPMICLVVPVIGMSAHIYVFLISCIWVSFIREPPEDDPSSVGMLSQALSAEICVSNVAILFYSRREIQDIVDAYRYCYENIPLNSRFYKSVQEHLKILKMRMVVFSWATILLSFSFIAPAILLPEPRLIGESFFLLGLEPIMESPNRNIANAAIAAAIANIGVLCVNVNCFIIALLGFSEGQLWALGDDVLHLWDDAVKHYDANFHYNNLCDECDESKEKIINDYIKIKLFSIYKRHSANVKVFRHFEEILRLIVVVNFGWLFSGTALIILSDFNMSLAFQLIYIYLQVGYWCWLGQKIIDASDHFENAVYSCKWENFNNLNAKTIALMHLNAQKTLMCSAGGLATLNYITFMSILAKTYSAYNSLRSAKGRQ